MPKKEFRGVWIATVVNIDWPKHKEDSVEKQKKDFVEILDFYQKLNFNAVIVQIRTAGDAFYPTLLAPWSKYLTGEQGKAPEDFEDPLHWMIHETHLRNLEFHAWLNPYRATFDKDTLSLDSTHDFYQHKDWMVPYGKKYYYNPGLPQVRTKFSKIVQELVKTYDLDAVHFDDYFYPYKIKGETFNDSIAYQQNRLSGQILDDWRRSNVDSLVKQVNTVIKKTKPWVQFGISPFGVWRNKNMDPKGSETKAGQTTYDDLYADPLQWIKNDWIDYLAPQAYWSMDYAPASYRNVSSWWNSQQETVNLYMGNGPYKIMNNADEAWNDKNEIPNQLRFTRTLPRVNGNLFFSAKSLMGQHEKVVEKIKKIYRLPAIPPSIKTKQSRNLSPVDIQIKTASKNKLNICISHVDSVPRQALFFLKNDKDPRKNILFKKSYLSYEQEKKCVEIALYGKLRRKNIQILVQDVYGNRTKPLTFNSKSLP